MKSCLNLRLSNFLTLLCLALSVCVQAQLSPDKTATENKLDKAYLFPINPGMQNSLTGSMGELRATHFHAGIDIRTNNTIGMPIRATKQGYVSYVSVSAYGYGNAIFITHPDGNMSVYAHMDRFRGKVAAFILQKQYEQKSFDLSLELPPNQFPIAQGDTIGNVGNTGGSGGPHLHFEIRDSANQALNPLRFQFSEIKDDMPPVAQKIAIKTLDINSRINGKFGRFEFFLLHNGNSYQLPSPIRAKGKIGIELLGYDKMNFSSFRCGINQIEMTADSEKIFSQHIDKINFFESSDIVALMDYQTLKTRGLRFNKLYIEDGNPLNHYEDRKLNGVITVGENPRNVQVSLKDTYGNESLVKVKLIPDQPGKVLISRIQKQFDYEITENVLSLQVQPCAPKNKIVVYEKGSAEALSPSYESNGQQVFLFDLRKMIPDSVQSCFGMVRFDIAEQIPSQVEHSFFSKWTDIRFHKNSLYDTLYLKLSKSPKNNSTVFSIGRETEPLNDSIDITLKDLTDGVGDSKVAVYRKDGRMNEYIGGLWEGSNITFTTRKLGDFILLKDSIAPSIYRIYCNSSNARFRISDNLSGIQKFEATINGEWVLMKYDYKSGILQSELLDPAKPLKGEFELKVTDRAGNQNSYKQTIY